MSNIWPVGQKGPNQGVQNSRLLILKKDTSLIVNLFIMCSYLFAIKHMLSCCEVVIVPINLKSSLQVFNLKPQQWEGSSWWDYCNNLSWQPCKFAPRQHNTSPTWSCTWVFAVNTPENLLDLLNVSYSQLLCLILPLFCYSNIKHRTLKWRAALGNPV